MVVQAVFAVVAVADFVVETVPETVEPGDYRCVVEEAVQLPLVDQVDRVVAVVAIAVAAVDLGCKVAVAHSI